MKILKVKLVGTRPFMMHSDKFADPLNPLTKAHKQLTSVRKKTDEDSENIAKSEWLGSLYHNDEIGPYIPGEMIAAVIVAGAKLSKLGTQIRRSVEVIDEFSPLIYSGPRNAEGLWKAKFYDARSVKVQASRLIRYRPIFRQWEATCDIAFDEEIINREQVLKCLQDGGMYCGIGDYRPKFGRFNVEVVE